MSQSIPYKASGLNYSKSGDGEMPLLLFHGFGQTRHVFDGYVTTLGKFYTLYSFDLYFHGESYWDAGKPLEKSDWKNIMDLFIAKENIGRFAVAGYSLGGKFALTTVELFSERIERIFLLAPDGVKINFWYTLATWPLANRWIFRSMIRHPGRFRNVVRLLQEAGIVHHGILRFAESQMNTEEKRERVYRTWVCFRHLRPDINEIAKRINAHKIPLTLIVGRFDRMIPAKLMEGFLDRLDHKRVEVLEAGHNDIIAESPPFFVP